MNVIAYDYDADHHCEECTKKYVIEITKHVPWGPLWDEFQEGTIELTDGEGNPIHPLFDTDEWYANDIYEGKPKATLACGTCGTVIEEVDLAE